MALLCYPLPPFPESLLRARTGARAKGCRIKHTFAIRTHPLDRVSSPHLFLSLGVLPVLKYDRAAGGLESTSRCCCRCQLPLMVIPWKWTLLRGQRRQSGKVPIIFAAIDASCQASSDKSAESAVRPASVPEALTRHRVMSRNARRSKFSVPFPLLHFVAEQSSYLIFLFDLTIFHWLSFSEIVETNINNFGAQWWWCCRR